MENLTHLDTVEEPHNSKPLESQAVSLEPLPEQSKPLQGKRITTDLKRNKIPEIVTDKKLLRTIRHERMLVINSREEEFKSLVAKYKG